MSRSFYIFLIKNFCIFFWPLLTSCSAFSYRPLFYKSGSCNSKFFLCVPSCQDNSGSFPFSQHGSFYIRSFSLWSDKYNIHLHRILFSRWSESLFSLLLLLHFWQLSVWSQSVLPVLPAFEFSSVFYHPTVCLLHSKSRQMHRKKAKQRVKRRKRQQRNRKKNRKVKQ